VQLPGRESRLGDALPTNLAELAADVVDALSEEIVGPYALFGHSCGALLAYEVGREIHRRDLPPPRALLVSGGRVPGARPDRLLHRLDEHELQKFVAEQGGLPPSLVAHPNLVAQLLGVVRADLALTEKHDPRPIELVQVPLHAFGGREDATVSLTEVEQWRLLAGGLFTLHSYPGGHFHLYADPGPLLADVAGLVTAPT
jgi:medium-chain acyl-[acyl-carrier-protein] hydrolase